MNQHRPRLWIRLYQHVSQKPPDSYRAVTHRAGHWIEIRGYVGYPGEELPYGRLAEEWSFWENFDLDLSPIFKEEQVERVYVEPGHGHAARLREAAGAGAPFGVTVAEGPPSTERRC